MPAAAIHHDGTRSVDTLLHDLACRLRDQGWRVRGLVMTYPQGRAGCESAMVLVDLSSTEQFLVSQPLGAGSTGCRADTQGFARASQVLRRALTDPAGLPDLVVVNRFGSLESEGGGFAAELLELLSNDVPVLTALAPRHQQAWQQFTGGAPLLPAEPAAVQQWLDTVSRRGLPVALDR